MSKLVQIEPFTIAIPDAVLDELHGRIRRTRWPTGVAASGWEEGTAADYLQDLLAAWAAFDWRARERALARSLISGR